MLTSGTFAANAVLGARRPSTTAGFAKMVERVGISAKLAFKVHPHMLRHACGFALANKGKKQ